MKKGLLVLLLLCFACVGLGQTYFSMPSTDATWRYRFIVIDDSKEITDNVLLVNGTDTVSGGNTYHKIFSRSYYQSVAISDPTPPVANVTASFSDIYFGAFRESGKKIYLLSASGEHVIYDFNVGVGDLIQGYSGMVAVTALDSVSLADGYHKRYKTTDTGYSVIEGVGSSRGLIPQLISGTGLNSFMCFSHNSVTYVAPMSAGVPCTYIAPLPAEGAVANVGYNAMGMSIFPIPANGMLHIVPTRGETANAVLTNSLGQTVWQGAVKGNTNIDVSQWAKGIYFLRLYNGNNSVSEKVIVE